MSTLRRIPFWVPKQGSRVVLLCALALFGCASNVSAEEDAKTETERRKQTLLAAAENADVKIAESSAELNAALETARKELEVADAAVLDATAKKLEELKAAAVNERTLLRQQLLVALDQKLKETEKKLEEAEKRLEEAEKRLKGANEANKDRLETIHEEMNLHWKRLVVLNESVTPLASEAPLTETRLAALEADLTRVSMLQNKRIGMNDEEKAELAQSFWIAEGGFKDKVKLEIEGWMETKFFAWLVSAIGVTGLGGGGAYFWYLRRRKETAEPKAEKPTPASA